MTATISHLPTWPADVPVHPAAELFPLMGGAEFAELVKDVRENGLVTPIVRTPDGSILDGRNRYRACSEAEVTPAYETHDGEPWRFVISTNLHRRHLTDSQRAMVAAKIAERALGSNQYQPQVGVSADTPTLEAPPSRLEAARMLNVSTSQVGRARVVERRGTPELKAAVESGSVPVSTAARVAAELPPAQQNEFVKQVNDGANPRTVSPPDPSWRKSDTASVPVAPAASGDTVSRKAVRNVADTVAGIGIGLTNATGVDPAITDEEAARWMDGLSQGIRSLRKLHTLLKERNA